MLQRYNDQAIDIQCCVCTGYLGINVPTVLVDDELLENTDRNLEGVLKTMKTILAEPHANMQPMDKADMYDYILQQDDNRLMILAAEAVKALDALSEEALAAYNDNDVHHAEKDHHTTPVSD
jgi:hypothetical protein